ncbi:hypothetical protein RB195_014204 [Necator americanus]|uniref:Uncharacterized protein n=1 Tax=Necator americanus TaxID=51031 RepID=A0ABR1DZ53_NECAM
MVLGLGFTRSQACISTRRSTRLSKYSTAKLTTSTKKWICYWKEKNRSRVVSSARSKITRITTRLDNAADIRIPSHVRYKRPTCNYATDAFNLVTWKTVESRAHSALLLIMCFYARTNHLRLPPTSGAKFEISSPPRRRGALVDSTTAILPPSLLRWRPSPSILLAVASCCRHNYYIQSPSSCRCCQYSVACHLRSTLVSIRQFLRQFDSLAVFMCLTRFAVANDRWTDGHSRKDAERVEEHINRGWDYDQQQHTVTVSSERSSTVL